MKRIAMWVGVVFRFLILVVVSLPFLIDMDQFRPTLQSDLSSALGREVTLGNLQLKSRVAFADAARYGNRFDERRLTR